MNEDQDKACLEEKVARLNAELGSAKRQLAMSYKMMSIGRLVAGVIHEINTPIGSILSNNEVALRSLEKISRLLEAAPSDNTDSREALALIGTLSNLAAVDKLACERISSVVRSLKTFARVDEGDLKHADINEILRNTLKLCDCEFRRRVRVRTELGELPEARCYPHLLSQVFLNLLVNASQAIDGEGDIVVRTGRHGDQVHVAITDTGQGIRPEDREKIFSPGFTTKPVGEGTGLGLGICWEIVVEAHGGTIDFESKPGKGTTFHVCIPLEPPIRGD